MLVYLLRNTVNRKVYIGKTIRTLTERVAEHFKAARLGTDSSRALHRAIRKHGVFAWDIFTLDTAATDEELCKQEEHWISLFDSTNPAKGYNLTYGGESGKQVPEVIATIRAKLTGQKRSPEQRENIRQAALARLFAPRPAQRAAMLGRKHSEESKAKASAAQKGIPRPYASKPHSSETRAKISASRTGKKYPRRSAC